MHENVYPRILRMTLILQTAYYFLTGIWPFIDFHTFESVTGDKTDDWLAYMVSAQVLSTAVFISLAYSKNRLRTAGILGILMAFVLGSTETFFALNNRISDIYLADALIELLFIVGNLSGILIFQNSPRV